MRWAFKKDIPIEYRHLGKKVQFLFCVAWIVRDCNGLVLMPDGQWAKAIDFYLTTPGHVIGLRDLSSADACRWSNEWRQAMSDRILEGL